jgi:hypothetical protein
VPFEDIVFDTFDGGSIPVSAASDEQELRLRDAIVPIDEPRYVDASNVARVLQRADPVIGYATPGDDAYAYPHRVLFVHEIVNDTVGGQTILVSRLHPVQQRRGVRPGVARRNRAHVRQHQRLHENDLVMFDHRTLS